MMNKRERYSKNPFLEGTAELAMLGTRVVCAKEDKSLKVYNEDTGDVQGLAGYWYKQDVDKTQFCKIYAEGLSAILDLKSPGKKVFQIIYNLLLDEFGKTDLLLSYEFLQENIPESMQKISRTTFYNGIKECIKRNIIAASISPNYYFVNPAYIFNGKRIGIIKEYVLTENTGKQIDFIDRQSPKTTPEQKFKEINQHIKEISKQGETAENPDQTELFK